MFILDFTSGLFFCIYLCYFSDNPELVASSRVMGSSLDGNLAAELLAEDLNVRCLWKLCLEDENNTILREEFFYQQVIT